jgi:hypothetical protein
LIEPYLRVLARHGLIPENENVFGEPADCQLRRGDLDALQNRPLVRGDEGEGGDRGGRLPILG